PSFAGRRQCPFRHLSETRPDWGDSVVPVAFILAPAERSFNIRAGSGRKLHPMNRFAAVLATLVLALPAHGVELPARCNDAYLAAMLSGVGQRCPSHHFHLTEAGKSRMYALMRASGG